MRAYETTVGPVTIATFPASRPAFAIEDISSSTQFFDYISYVLLLEPKCRSDHCTVISFATLFERSRILSRTASVHGLRGPLGSSFRLMHAIVMISPIFTTIGNDPRS